MTRERKIYAMILALGVVAFAVDRLMFGGGGPQSASAEPARVGEAEDAGGALDRPAPVPHIGIEPRYSLAHHLDAVAATWELDANNCGNAFRPAGPWADASDAAGAPRPAGEPTPGERFARRHELRAVYVSRGGGMALLAGSHSPLTVGESVEGFTLTAVSPRAAVFELDEHRVRLELKHPRGNNSQNPPIPIRRR